jgi:hypothetical protein
LRSASRLISAARTSTVQSPATGLGTNTFSTVSIVLGLPPGVEAVPAASPLLPW